MTELNNFRYPFDKPKQQCETIKDLHLEWARVLDMCKGTEVLPTTCVSYKGNPCKMRCNFSRHPSHYHFAVVIVEGRCVFPGTKLCHSFLGEVVVTGGSKNNRVAFISYSAGGKEGLVKTVDPTNLSWTPGTPWNVRIGVDLACGPDRVSIQPTEYTSTPGAIKYVPDLGSALLQVNMKQLALAIEQREEVIKDNVALRRKIASLENNLEVVGKLSAARYEANRNLLKELNDLRARLEAIKNLGSV